MDFCDQNRPLMLRFRFYPPLEDDHDHDELRRKREVLPELLEYYTYDVADENSYIDSAFCSATENEAYLFMKNEYVIVNYSAARDSSINGRVVKGPLFLCDGFQSLASTTFAEHGIDCAFGCPGTTEAFIFCGKLCARINYAAPQGTTNDVIIEGPTTIAKMFPFFKNTSFEAGCDAAFESSCLDEAYIFAGKYYALINYSERRLRASGLITEGFPSLEGTIFASGIGAALATSDQMGGYYLFKDQYYVLVCFTPGAHDDYVIDDVKEIRPNWPFLRDILPRKNRGLDIHDHPHPELDQLLELYP